MTRISSLPDVTAEGGAAPADVLEIERDADGFSYRVPVSELVSGSGGVTPPQVLNVGPQRPYTTIQAAIDAIADAAQDKPYLVLVDPGEYLNGFNLSNRNDIEVRGVSQKGTRIHTARGDSNSITLSGTRLGVSNMTVVYDDGPSIANEQTCMKFTAPGITECTVKDVDFDIQITEPGRTGQVYAMGAPAFRGNSSETWGLKAYNVNIFTQSCGIQFCWDYAEFYNLHVQLKDGGADTAIMDMIAWNHQNPGRAVIADARITTGYSFDNPVRPGGNIYGFYVDVRDIINSRGNGRINLKGLEGILRNNAAGDETVYVKIGPNAQGQGLDFVTWETRLWSFKGQCETGDIPNAGIVRLFDTPYGPSEAFGRVLLMDRNFNNNVNDVNIVGARFHLDDTADGWNLYQRDVKSGGLWHCTNASDITLNIPNITSSLGYPIRIAAAGAGDVILSSDAFVDLATSAATYTIPSGTVKTIERLGNGDGWLVY